jgi:hypothetical protein
MLVLTISKREKVHLEMNNSITNFISDTPKRTEVALLK